jgi:signal transduction histidine kinase/ActR/RegA family two-component response regulator
MTRDLLFSMADGRETEKVGAVGGIVESLVAEYAEGAQLAARALGSSERLVQAIGNPGAAKSREIFRAVLNPLVSENYLDILEVIDDREIVRYRAHEVGHVGDRATAWGVSEALHGKRTMVAHKLPNGTAVLAIEPLYNDNRIVGAVIAGRRLNEKFIKDIGMKVNADLALVSRNQVLASTSEIASSTMDKMAIEEAFHQKIPIHRTDSVGHAKVVYVPLLIIDEGFVMMVRIDSNAANRALQDSFALMIKWTAGFLLVSIVIASILLRIVLKPLRVLRSRAEQTAITATGEAIMTKATDEIGSVVHVLDTLTERLLAQNRDLSQSRADAQAANEAKSQFLSTMSHEIRTPLNGVLGMAELLEETALTEEQARYCRAIATSGRTLYELLSDILDLSKIEAGKIQIETIDFDLAFQLGEVTSLYSELAATRSNKLLVEIDIPTPGCFRGDPTRLRQVLSNILSNAIKFTEGGDIAFSVSALAPRAEDPRTWLRFNVRDNGIGIAPEKLKSLVRPFTQADSSTTRRYGGTGLGLVISKQLVEFLGGCLHIESSLGAGTHVWFELPFAAAKHAETARSSGTPPAAGRLSARVLLAEDNPVNQEVICAMLGISGAEVMVVENGELAVQALRQGEFDVVLMDCQMPVMDGYEATARIRQEEAPGRHIPIIALTANAFSEDRERCVAVGMDDYLGKPVKRDQLVRIISRWVGRSTITT